MRLLWIGLGFACLGIGTLGIFVPLLPTVVFWIIAAFAFSKSSPHLHAWMMDHRVIGPPLHDWYENGAINRRAKWTATFTMALVVLISLYLRLSPTVIIIQVLRARIGADFHLEYARQLDQNAI